MNILFINNFFVGFMISEIPRVSVFGYFPLCVWVCARVYTRVRLTPCVYECIYNYSYIGASEFI